MARADVKEGILRGCPVCGTKVKDADLGLREYGWLNEALPGKVGLMDADAMLTQASTGRALFLEFKPRSERISTGARLTFALFVKAGFDVWVIWDVGKDRVKVGECNERGRTPVVREMTKKRAARLVALWWEEGQDE